MKVKKMVVVLLALFLIVGFVSQVDFALAKDGDDNSGSDDSSSSSSDDGGSSDDSGSNKDDKKDSDDNDSGSKKEDKEDKKDSDKKEDKQETKTTETTTDENGNEVKIVTKSKTKDGETETKETRTYLDADGNEVKIVTKSKNKEGKQETEVERTVKGLNGVKVTIKTKTEIKDNKEKTTYSIKVKGTEVTTKLKIKEETKDGQTKLKVQLSTGVDQDIIVSPDEAMAIALDELRAGGIMIDIKEVGEGDKIKAVFSARTSNPGRFLGIFNTQVNLETLIDIETGEIIQTNRPWWAFLVVGQDKSDICHIPDDDINKRLNLNIAIPAIKAHLDHGDSVGACVAECGDEILVEGDELCEIGTTQICTTTEGYFGTETCNLTCDGFDECISTESCGDSVVNGNEACDDGNVLDGDGCSPVCEVEVSVPVNETTNATI